MHWLSQRRRIPWLGIVLVAVGRVAIAQPVFRVPLAFPVGNEPETIAAADVDGDADVDIAIASAADGTISVLHNDALGNFSIRTTARVGQRPRHVLLADIDADGDPDLLTANQNSSTVSVLMNRGGGEFSMRINYAAGATPQHLAVGDLDGDGDLDLAVANGGAGVAGVLRNVGGSAFQVANTIYMDGEIVAVALGDMDGDQDMDVVAANRYLGLILMALNQGDFVFTAPEAFKTAGQLTGLALADVDGDNDLDVVSAHAGTPALNVSTNAGNGRLGRAIPYATGNSMTGARTLKCGDLDADGDADVVVVNGPANGSTLALLFNDGAGRFGTPLNLQVTHDGHNAMPLYDAVIAACDADARMDIATVGHVTAPGWSGVALAFADPRLGRFAPPRSLSTLDNPAALVAADFDADTIPDLAVLDIVSGAIAVHHGSGGGAFAAPDPRPTGSRAAVLASGDVDADGDQDLVTAVGDPDTEAATVLWNDGAGHFPQATALPRAGAGHAGIRDVLAIDLDGDSDVDLVTADSAASRICVYSNAGGGVFDAPTAYGGAGHPLGVCASDVDGDGDPDLVVAVDGPTSRLLWNAGDGTFAAQTGLVLGSGPSCQVSADFDADGDADIASLLRGTGTIAVSSNQGGTDFAPAALFFSGDATGSGRIRAADVDGDGDVDLVGANRVSGSVSWLANDGTGGFVLPVHLAAGSRPCAIVAVDVDGDGDLDLALANAGAGQVSLLANTTRSVPVLLADWVARETARGTVLLSWSVTGDTPLAGFRIERWTESAAAHTATPSLGASARAYEDRDVHPGTTYRYILVARDLQGSTVRSAAVAITTRQTRLLLLPPSPNPSTGGALIRLGLPETMAVQVSLYDVRGMRVAQLVDAMLPPGVHALRWSGRDETDAAVPAGVYLCRVRAGASLLVEKLVVAPRSPQR